MHANDRIVGPLFWRGSDAASSPSPSQGCDVTLKLVGGGGRAAGGGIWGTGGYTGGCWAASSTALGLPAAEASLLFLGPQARASLHSGLAAHAQGSEPRGPACLRAAAGAEDCELTGVQT